MRSKGGRVFDIAWLRPGLLAATACWSLAAIGCASSDESDGLDPRCDAPCARRTAKGCAGVEEYCKATCTAVYEAAKAEGSCQAAAEAKEDCFNSKEVLDLGCAAAYDDRAALCQSQLDALDACREARDG